jgi:predicted nucleic acid-binding protein
MKLAYIDSCVYISRFEGIPAYRAVIEQGLQQLARDGWVACISELVSLEVLINPLKQGQHGLVLQYKRLFGTVNIFTVYPHIFKDALQIAQSENLKAVDAIHVAFAKHYDCQLFVSSDPHFRDLATMTPYWIDLREHAPSARANAPDSDPTQAAD